MYQRNEKESISEDAWQDMKLVFTFSWEKFNFIKEVVLLVVDQ